MERIWKYTIPLASSFQLSMPKGALMIAVQTQRNIPVLWAIVDDEAQPERRTFGVIDTGQKIINHRRHYIGTFQMDMGSYVGHLFEFNPKPETNLKLLKTKEKKS